ncbi:MAG: carbohydrate-binding protein [Solirubrobacterales bacterium]|nr:carbohydrate-binding protein [Solirubrobacterales bacterium]
MLLTLAVIALAGTPARAATLPPQGVYDQCSPATDPTACLGTLDRVAGAGFSLMLNYSQLTASPEQLRALSRHAADLGVKLIWPLSNPVWRRGGELAKQYPQLAAACGCGSDELLAYVIGLAQHEPGTWGYYIGDEVTPEELPAVQALAARVKALDPQHPTLYFAYENMATLGKNLQPFASVADVAGAATYPVGTVQSVSFTETIAQLIRRILAPARRRTALVLQAFDWSQYPGDYPGAIGFPTFRQLRAQRDAALAGGPPSMLLWYSLHDIDRSGDPAGHWSDLVRAAFGPPPARCRAGGPIRWSRSRWCARGARARADTP